MKRLPKDSDDSVSDEGPKLNISKAPKMLKFPSDSTGLIQKRKNFDSDSSDLWKDADFENEPESAVARLSPDKATVEANDPSRRSINLKRPSELATDFREEAK